MESKKKQELLFKFEDLVNVLIDRHEVLTPEGKKVSEAIEEVRELINKQ
jgi:hypothetical protein